MGVDQHERAPGSLPVNLYCKLTLAGEENGKSFRKQPYR